jgi:SMC interacting uncharacterized protein involved in chromosome segregation
LNVFLDGGVKDILKGCADQLPEDIKKRLSDFYKRFADEDNKMNQEKEGQMKEIKDKFVDNLKRMQTLLKTKREEAEVIAKQCAELRKNTTTKRVLQTATPIALEKCYLTANALKLDVANELKKL